MPEANVSDEENTSLQKRLICIFFVRSCKMELGCGLRESIVEKDRLFAKRSWRRRESVTPGNRACWGLFGLVPIEFGLGYVLQSTNSSGVWMLFCSSWVKPHTI
ncbi:unnamed protein product [Sphagnum jensenii]|uniref:Uncharacterized protein n=1 Tax=Sphagnum jensenii TaxID=128206 RepID=A0ABP0X3J8_9BRYO